MFEGFSFKSFSARLSCRTGPLRSATPQTKTCLWGPRFARALRALFTPSVAAPVGRFRRFAGAGLVCLLAVVMLGASPDARFEKMGHEMICTCGCGQILLECNHVGCPVSPVMIGELHAQIDGGGTNTSIFNWFAAKYGAIVLASPIRGGFDNVAWVAPMAVFLLATIGTGFLVRMWSSRSRQRRAVTAGGVVVGSDAMRERIRRETEY